MEHLAESSELSVPKVCVQREKQYCDFVYKFRSRGNTHQLRVPLQLPFVGNTRELAVRLVNVHKLPCYLEDDLCSQLKQFAKDETLKLLDTQAEENLFGVSPPVEGVEAGQVIGKWVDCFSENHVEFYSPVENNGLGFGNEVTFSEIYHKLIHSPALDTLLQLEHTYAIAVSEVCKARDNARGIMQKRHDGELFKAMKDLDSQSSEADINTMMRQHTAEREQCESLWSSELSQLQETQRREYREWVIKVNEEMSEKEKVKGFSSRERGIGNVSETVFSPSNAQDEALATESPLEESFTIYLGAQKKTMHNVRLMCCDSLDLCQHKRNPHHPVASPERLLTAMSLYSTKLSALVLMVDGRINSLGGIKESFANVCHQSTDFHFHDVDVQLSKIQECAVTGNNERQEHKLAGNSMNSQNSTSDSQISRSFSPLSLTSPERAGSVSSFGVRGSLSQTSSNTVHPPPSDPIKAKGVSDGAGPVAWAVRDLGDDRNGDDEGMSSSLLETTSVGLEPGDFYLTKHSNLSSVHIVFHLVTDESAVLSTNLKSRHPVVVGLKNCLRTASRHDVHHITIPLLLVHTMLPEMTISWCMKRAELVFKCVKGFMLENSTWGDGDSRTIQFLVPSGISEVVFGDFCDMFPRIFRVASSRNLTSTRTRFNSYR